jgi:AcrR family transcriptional regulator
MPKIVDHDAQRAAIVATAAQMFVEQGYSGLGMRELARALGMSKSALYHYFPSKEALFAAVTESVLASDIAAFDMQALATASFAEKLDALLDHVESHEAWYVQQIHILLEYVRVRDGATGAASMRLAAEQYAGAMADFLGVSADVGWALYCQINGVIMQRHLDGGMTDFRGALHWVVRSLTEQQQTARR